MTLALYTRIIHLSLLLKIAMEYVEVNPCLKKKKMYTKTELNSSQGSADKTTLLKFTPKTFLSAQRGLMISISYFSLTDFFFFLSLITHMHTYPHKPGLFLFLNLTAPVILFDQ